MDRVRWFVAILLVASGCVEEGLSLGLPPPGAPGVGDPARYACLNLEPDYLRWMVEAIGTTEEKQVELRSACAWDVELSELVLRSEHGDFAVVTRAPAIVRAKTAMPIVVAFTSVPDRPGDRGTVQLVFEGFEDPRLSIRMRGDSLGPQPIVDYQALDFGEVVYEASSGFGSPSRCRSDLRFAHVANVGWETLEIGRAYTQGDQFTVEFVEVGGVISPSGGPHLVPPGQRAEIAVRYRPHGIVDERGALHISHNGYRGVSEVALTGTGVAPVPVTEVFEQDQRVAVDILWAIDSSGSMEEEHALLIENLGFFVGYADAIGADYQMAVIEAQEVVDGAGLFRSCEPHPSIVHATYADTETRDDAFMCMVDVGTEGFATETALGASRIALERARYPEGFPTSDVENPNAGFLRPNADLAVIAISDEDDQSNIESDVLIDALFAAKDYERGRVKLHAIAGPTPDTCQYAEEGTRYQHAVSSTDGLFLGICEPDWRPLLENLGLDVFQPRYRFALRHPADPSTIVVRVNGRPVAENPFSGWQYLEARRLITFRGGSVPPMGARIEVTYVPRCPR